MRLRAADVGRAVVEDDVEGGDPLRLGVHESTHYGAALGGGELVMSSVSEWAPQIDCNMPTAVNK
jgi:hypothetical protein